MKQFFLTVSIFSLFLVSTALAQTPSGPLTSSCSPYITASNYSTCCTRAARDQHAFSCTTYEKNNAPGTIGNGAPGTNPVNNVTFDTGNPTNSTASSTTSSANLSSCSSMKFQSLLDILIWVKCVIVVAIIPLIFAAALMFFLWGVMKFIAASSPDKKKEGKNFIIAGLIGLFVMTSLWGIIKIAGTTLGVDSSVVPLLQTK